MYNPALENDLSLGLSNLEIAERLEEMADLLADRGANPYRIRAFRNGALTVVHLDEPVSRLIAREGPGGLTRLPGIGRALGRAITELALTGRWSRRDALLPGADSFTDLPGVGPKLAKRLRDALGSDSLEALAEAARDGRLGRVPGVGPRRAAAIRTALGERARRRWRLNRARDPAPGVAQILAVDREYRERHVAVMHTDRDRWHLTALHADSALARRLGRGRDWVIVYHDDGAHTGLHTVVTEQRGPLAGQRVVRGREAECREYYRGLDAIASDRTANRRSVPPAPALSNAP